MTTQTQFDLAGFLTAIETSDSCYQAALYNEHAEVRIIGNATDTDSDTDSGKSPLLLRGRAAIQDWIESWGPAAGMHQGVAHLEFTHDQLSLVRELRSADLSCITYKSSAHVRRGQIVTERVQHVSTTSARAVSSQPQRAPDGIMIDEAPQRKAVRPGVSARDRGGRSLPGLYLG